MVICILIIQDLKQLVNAVLPTLTDILYKKRHLEESKCRFRLYSMHQIKRAE